MGEGRSPRRTLIPKVNSTVGRGEEMTMGKGGIKDEKEGQVQEK